MQGVGPDEVIRSLCLAGVRVRIRVAIGTGGVESVSGHISEGEGAIAGHTSHAITSTMLHSRPLVAGLAVKERVRGR